MSLDTTSHDIYRGTSGITLPKEVSDFVISNAIAESAIMRLAQRVYLPGRGLAIPVITGDPTVSIVNEAAEKPVSNSTFTTKNMVPKKFAFIQTFSNELRRDMPALYDECIARMPRLLAKAFDTQGFTQSALTGFDSFVNVTTISSGADFAAKLVNGIKAIAADGFRMNGIAAGAIAEADIKTATNALGVPLFIESIQDGRIGRVYGADVVPTGAINGLIAGDWSQAKYGIVDGITLKFSDQATVNDGTAQINLWQRNMFAALVEFEASLVIADDDAFFQIAASGATGATE